MSTSVAPAPHHPRVAVLIQFVKFGIVGISNTLLTFIVYTLLLKVFGVNYLLASAIGFIVGGAALVSAVVLYLTTPHSQETSFVFAPVPLQGGGGGFLSARF